MLEEQYNKGCRSQGNLLHQRNYFQRSPQIKYADRSREEIFGNYEQNDKILHVTPIKSNNQESKLNHSLSDVNGIYQMLDNLSSRLSDQCQFKQAQNQLYLSANNKHSISPNNIPIPPKSISPKQMKQQFLASSQKNFAVEYNLKQNGGEQYTYSKLGNKSLSPIIEQETQVRSLAFKVSSLGSQNFDLLGFQKIFKQAGLQLVQCEFQKIGSPNGVVKLRVSPFNKQARVQKSSIKLSNQQLDQKMSDLCINLVQAKLSHMGVKMEYQSNPQGNFKKRTPFTHFQCPQYRAK